ncbi:type II toxin-antitoxin system ParD family antitoxin [Marinimicrobium koreense]|uniref:type II toxin-antitoxin system ParD family antitoxin n=1 Tax=Marinimicrobium koreense TaxID=306545 RepID=UPI003F72B518
MARTTKEVVYSTMHLLERHESQTQALRQAVEAGEKSGESDLTLRDVAAEVKRKNGL